VLGGRLRNWSFFGSQKRLVDAGERHRRKVPDLTQMCAPGSNIVPIGWFDGLTFRIPSGPYNDPFRLFALANKPYGWINLGVALPGHELKALFLELITNHLNRKILNAYFSPSWTAFQAERGRDFSVIVDGISN
jgi:hypothetical protein